MVAIFSAAGFFVHTPFGPRKSGMPESVEMPAPVSTVIRSAPATHCATSASSSSRSMLPVSPAGEDVFPSPLVATPRGSADISLPPTSPATGGPRMSAHPSPLPDAPDLSAPLPPSVHVTPWHDPVVDRRGHDP